MRCLLSLALLLPLATAQHTRWADRLGTRVGRPIEPPSPPPPPQMPSEAVLAELRTFVERTVEPSIALMRAHEIERGNDETCFASSGGQHLRYRCCVYFTALSAALLEWRFGEAPGAATTWRVLSPLAYDAERPVPDRQLLYGLLARWFLQPPAAAQAAGPRVAMLQAAAGGDDYDLAALRRAASLLPGPLGRYAAPLTVLGVPMMLWRCEVSTTHSYLRLEAAGRDDVLVDVSFKQFLVMPEWMEPRHFDACQAHGFFSAQPEYFVGTPCLAG